mgnify:CR=1 FL=1
MLPADPVQLIDTYKRQAARINPEPVYSLCTGAEQSDILRDQAGGTLIGGVMVDRFNYDSETKRVKSVHLADGRTIEADAFITALPHGRLEDLATSEMMADDERLEMLKLIEDVPVIGVARSDWSDEDFRTHARESIEKHITAGLLEQRDGHLRLTHEGRFFADSVVSDLL